MIKLIAFDWNGTIMADTNAVVEATNLTRKEYGYPPISLYQFQKTLVIPIVDYWVANGGKKEDIATQHVIFHKNYESLLERIRTRKNAKTTLAWLARNHIRSIIYSNHTQAEIMAQLKRFKIGSYFEAVLARSGVKDQRHLHKRHKGEKLSAYIKSHRLNPREIISIGDTCEEIEIGQELKTWTVAITGGENSVSRLKQCRPNFLINNLSELKKIIKDIR